MRLLKKVKVRGEILPAVTNGVILQVSKGQDALMVPNVSRRGEHKDLRMEINEWWKRGRPNIYTTGRERLKD